MALRKNNMEAILDTGDSWSKMVGEVGLGHSPPCAGI